MPKSNVGKIITKVSAWGQVTRAAATGVGGPLLGCGRKAQAVWSPHHASSLSVLCSRAAMGAGCARRAGRNPWACKNKGVKYLNGETLISSESSHKEGKHGCPNG